MDYQKAVRLTKCLSFQQKLHVQLLEQVILTPELNHLHAPLQFAIPVTISAYCKPMAFAQRKRISRDYYTIFQCFLPL